jgi:hypothetical protein
VPRSISLLIAVLVTIQATVLPVFAAPASDESTVTDAFVNRLLEEINLRRDAAGAVRLASAPSSANAMLNDFLTMSADSLMWPAPCSHQQVAGHFAWEYVRETGYSGEALGEVLACPGPDPYWTPDRTAEQWWRSPVHFGILYGDLEATTLACGVYGIHGGGKTTKSRSSAAATVLCVTFRG